jgi:uncharacterized protein
VVAPPRRVRGGELSERDSYPPGAPCWVDTLQPDPEAALRFYGELFGWEPEGPSPGGYFVARLRERDAAGVGSQPAAAAPPMWNTYVSVERAEDAAEKAAGAGGSVVLEPFDALPAGRVAVLADPAGAPFCVWEPREREGAQLVNEPGAWSMSALNTPDPDGAQAFYGAVFGWTTETFELGGGAVTLWRLPGYVGGEPGQPVSREVVATMAPMTGDKPDAPPYWSVDFWVDDVDATAGKAAALGGEAIAPPYDIPGAGFRQAVLADPQGAAFSVTKVTAGP